MVLAFFLSALIVPLFAVEAAGQEPRPVTVVAARQGAVTDRIAVVGTLVAREEIRVNPLVQEKEIRQILAEVGAFVEKGQPLAVLDDTDAGMLLDRNVVQGRRAEAAIAQERSRVEAAMITEREAHKLLERSRSLQVKGVVSQQILDEHENAHARALSQLELARQSLALAEADRALIERERLEIRLTIERSTVRAPASGLVLARNARVGAMTSSSGDPMFVIAEDGDIEMEARVSETGFVRLGEGMPAEIHVAGKARPLIGRVRLSAAQLDPATRMGTVRIALAGDEGLVAGAFGRGTINALQRRNILLPGTAVESRRGVHSVYVVDDGIVSPRIVTVGLQQGNLREVIEGLTEGELVVLKAGSFLKAEERIEPVVADYPGPSGPELSTFRSSLADITGATVR
ncbi:efflux RND transporter periplasmic adaptor subunit [Rhizobiaceae bacterium BDR2-2]|uniref:Efflux RND transporter periplasmic adaptor subunit n=1 Tax=Ectorhizobium quercum TaxID=2965071 RepID=A0AAE3MWI4_9HYPH|nr:efflux RND transporter periplasmic adaptor subunit [Ectorhizobium quercum]MCX8995706.1 efflux RND transporter periplasmic adaptor subunit [Ectorhizobium quercum]